MTLKRLAEYLTDLLEAGHDPDAKVLLNYQPGYPLECGIFGATTRAEIAEIAQRDEDDEPETSELREWQRISDVIICSGDGDLGYGTRSAWEAAENHR